MQVLVKSILIGNILNVLILNVQSAPRIDALVDTKVGLIRGLKATDGDYSMFMGIPYAEVEKDNPFGPSVPFPKFDATFEAYDDPDICPQMSNGNAIGTLDCLHLSVYVPNNATSQNRLPVLVYIYGGKFNVGNYGKKRYAPWNIVKHDVILVILNYRVGPYGFMCLDTPRVPGNQGLKDQRLALKWVKDNIEAFGGDSNEITISGESAGGVSVDLHLYYTEEKLFNKVILQSGNALCPWAVEEPDQFAPFKIAKQLGFESNDANEILSLLSATNPELVIAASSELNYEYSPCVEKDFQDVEKFIGDYPINTGIQKVKDFSILIGHNDEEYIEMLNFSSDYLLQEFRKELVKNFNFDSEELAAMEKNVRNFYIGDERTRELTIMPIVDFNSDFLFNYPTARSVSRYLENGATSVFYYVFSYNGGLNTEKFSEPNVYNISKGGAAHADELHYLFYVSNNNYPTVEDRTMVDQIGTLWTNFVKTGNPTPEASELIPLTWTPVSSDSLNYLSIGSELEVKRRPFHGRVAFWDLFYQLNRKAQKGYRE